MDKDKSTLITYQDMLDEGYGEVLALICQLIYNRKAQCSVPSAELVARAGDVLHLVYLGPYGELARVMSAMSGRRATFALSPDVCVHLDNPRRPDAYITRVLSIQMTHSDVTNVRRGQLTQTIEVRDRLTGNDVLFMRFFGATYVKSWHYVRK